jgi:hypothetical protein
MDGSQAHLAYNSAFDEFFPSPVSSLSISRVPWYIEKAELEYRKPTFEIESTKVKKIRKQ